MPNSEAEDGTNRDDLIQRLAMMETMIAEGRRSTTRCGWIFVLWGLVDIAGMAWEWWRPSYWIWPTVLAVGFAVMLLIQARLERGSARCVNVQSRTVSAIWGMMGLATTMYVFTAMFRHLTWQYSFVAAIFMFVGLAHATSAIVLRWRVQGAVAALWWIGGIATFFSHSGNVVFVIFPLEMLFGMVLFGLYGMWLDRRDRRVSANA